MLNTSNLTEIDKEILNDFFVKRNIFKSYLIGNDLHLSTCPGCGYPTILERGNFEICSVCNWEDDGYDDNSKSIFDTFFVDNNIGGPNGSLTLIQNRLNIGKTLQEYAKSVKGHINLDTSTVLKTIQLFNKKREEIEDRMTEEETSEHLIWTEWRQVDKDLQFALVIKGDQPE